MIQEFYKVLFEPCEQVCWTDTVFGITSRPVEEQTRYALNNQYFCINALKGDRLDENITSFRNILCEFDEGTIKEQLELIKDSQLPYSTITHSGGKSIHVIISLLVPLNTKEEYKILAKHIYKKLKGVDIKNSNPSRLSRSPLAQRDTGALQGLLDLKTRVALEDLLAWAGPMPKTEQRKMVEVPGIHKYLTMRALAFFKYPPAKGNRNSALFGVAIDMLRTGWTAEEIFEKATAAINLPSHEIKTTIRSAQKHV